MMLTYGLTAVISAAFLTFSLKTGQLKISRTPFDLPLLLFLLSQIAATLLSIDRHVSLFGYYSRFHGGLASTFSYIILFYVFVSYFKDKVNELNRILAFTLGSGFLVSLYGVFQRLGIDKDIWIQDVQNRVFSSLGQPNWLAAYLSVLAIITFNLFLNERKKQKIIYLVLGLLFYTVIIFSKSRSGFAGFWFGLWLSLLLNLIAFKNLLLIKKIGLILSLLILLTFIFGLPFTKLYPYTLEGLQNRLKQTPQSVSAVQPVKGGDSLIELNITESGQIRRIVWQGAWEIVKRNPWFGTGVETFAFAYYQVRPKEHNLTSEWDFLYNKAHNEYLNLAANTGFFGLASYLLLILTALYWFVRLFWQTKSFLVSGLTGAYLSIFFSNFFGFSVVIIGLFFFLLPAFNWVLLNRKNQEYQINLSAYQWLKIPLWLITSFLLFLLIRFWLADRYFALGHQYQQTNQLFYAYTYLKKAVNLNPFEPVFQEELAQVNALLSVVAKSQNENDLSEKLKNEALAQSEKLVRQYPKNLNFLKTRTKILYALTELEPALLQESLTTLLKAKELAPNDPKITYNLGLLYAKLEQTNQAIEILKETINLKPDYYEPRWALALFYEQIGQKKEAIEQLEFILNNIRFDEQAKEKLEKLKNLK